jgi:hypothetical protein
MEALRVDMRAPLLDILGQTQGQELAENLGGVRGSLHGRSEMDHAEIGAVVDDVEVAIGVPGELGGICEARRPI